LLRLWVQRAVCGLLAINVGSLAASVSSGARLLAPNVSPKHPLFASPRAAVCKPLQLQEALEYVRERDTLVVWRLDRLGRSLKHLIETITRLNNKNIGFKSITENIDTTTSGGKLVFHIFGALAEFERDIIKERSNAGLSAARARGRLGGRPKAKMGSPGIPVKTEHRLKVSLIFPML
jgi:Resolvase, N terminal domain